MKGPLARRLARARENTPTVPNPKAMTPEEKRNYAYRLLDFNTQVALMNRQAEAEGQAPWQIMKRAREQELAQPAASVAPEPAPKSAPTPKPSRPRHVGEADPDFVPPQNQYWEERCWFRARGPHDFYDDQPRRDDDDWEW